MASYNWDLYLRFAVNILGSVEFDEDTIARVATSRAYYAAFHAAEDYLLDSGVEVGYRSGSHETLCRCFKEMKYGTKNFRVSCSNIGNMLITLKKQRKCADYKANVPLSKKVANKNCVQAQEIINKIRALGSIS
ncbi:MAG: hypothetical protein IJC05_00940 [Phascolarctobacterium sp.]|nr:hypothetical protein [Phascolarctobacterium sp.]